MKQKDFSLVLETKMPAAEVFPLLLDVRNWWTGLYDEYFEGTADEPGKEFSFRAGGGMHYSRHKLTTLVPGQKIVWEVTDANLSFATPADEWKGTRITFDIAEENDVTRVVFTHEGLNGEMACYDNCSTAWSAYLTGRLASLLNRDFTTTILFDNTPAEVFKAILNPRAWWSEDIEGETTEVNDIFDYQFEDIHRCKMQLTVVVPDKKVVWHVLDNAFNFTNDKTEWIGTDVIFQLNEKNNQTQLIFTHAGLTPADECYDACYQGWSHYIGKSLREYVVTGTGLPNKGGKAQTDKEKELGGK